jgi:hypothetical protein
MSPPAVFHHEIGSLAPQPSGTLGTDQRLGIESRWMPCTSSRRPSKHRGSPRERQPELYGTNVESTAWFTRGGAAIARAIDQAQSFGFDRTIRVQHIRRPKSLPAAVALSRTDLEPHTVFEGRHRVPPTTDLVWRRAAPRPRLRLTRQNDRGHSPPPLGPVVTSSAAGSPSLRQTSGLASMCLFAGSAVVGAIPRLVHLGSKPATVRNGEPVGTSPRSDLAC